MTVITNGQKANAVENVYDREVNVTYGIKNGQKTHASGTLHAANRVLLGLLWLLPMRLVHAQEA